MKDEFTNYVELQAEKAESLSFCRGIKLLHIRDKVETMLSFIGRGGIFEEYTVHSIEHVDEMFDIVDWLIPEETKKEMSSAEWLMLSLAIYFHDLGMVVTKDEFEHRNTTSFKDYKEKLLYNMQNSEYGQYIMNQDDNFLYQEFVRENHATRIKQWIEGGQDISFGEADVAKKEIDDMLRNLDKMFRADLAMICESHHKDDIDNFEKYKVNTVYGNNTQEKVNLNYIAIILRAADLLHITKDRTPSVARKLINVSNPISVIEWEKQMAVRAIKPKVKRNGEGNIDESLQKDTIEVTAYFDGAETADAYFGLSSYLQYSRKELHKCNSIVEKSQKREGATVYKFPWIEVDESQITVKGFEPKKLQFTIAQDNILQLLVGHTLYNDSSVVVRELVQNGIDAVKLQKQYDEKDKISITDGKIDVEWDEAKRELIFWDNGTGMTIQDVEKYLLKVGASKYRDESIMKEFPEFNSISHFGIGILTCFMIANDIDIMTNSKEQCDANCINLRKVNGSYLLQKIKKSDLNEKIKQHGTMVKLYVRNDVDMSKVELDLRKWIIFPEIPVFYTANGNDPIQIGYNSPKDILVQYMDEVGYSIDGEKFDVYEKKHGNVTIAYAVRHLKYLSDWCLMEVDSRRTQRKVTLPIGTCVEGIRVEFSTPGYKNSSILAIANIVNSKYQTNVARSAIELDANSEILSDIYSVYKEYIQDQMDGLEKKNYSKSWALSEGRYLMRPLIYDDYSNIRIEPMDEEILIEKLAELKCMVIENQGKREMVSARHVFDTELINLYECKMVRAAEYLLKEIRSDATLGGLMGVVCSEVNFLNNVENVLCDYDYNNILHQYALRNKEVINIEIARKERRIHLTYSEKNQRWFEFDLKNRDGRRLFIPKTKFSIQGLEEEIGIKTQGGVFIQSDTEIHRYIMKSIDLFMEDDTDENRTILEIFLSNVFDSRILEQAYKKDINVNNVFRQVLEEKPQRMREDLLEKMWSKIDVDEFAKIILVQNYSLYSIDNWSRREDELY